MGMRLRASRAILVVLGLVLGAGTIITIVKLTGNRAPTPIAAARAQTPEPAPLMLAATTMPAPKRAAGPEISITPTTMPVERPVLLAAAPAAAAIAPPPPAAKPAAASSLDAAKAQYEAGELVAARQMLSEVMNSGKASDAEMAGARDLAHKVSAMLIFSGRVFGDDPYQASHMVQNGEVLERIAAKYDITAELLCRVNGISDPRKLAAGRKLKVVRGPMHAVVNKKSFMLDVYFGEPGAGGAMVMSFQVGLGKDDSTPTGTWVVEAGKKLKDPPFYPSESARANGEVFRAGKDPKNPLGTRWIPLTGIGGNAQGKESYGIHGTNQPDSIGKQSSLGCVRMHNEDVELVYEMLIGAKSKVVVRE